MVAAETTIEASTRHSYAQFMADIQETYRFAVEETDRIERYIQDLEPDCEANLPTSRAQILEKANEYIGTCLDLVTVGTELRDQYLRDSMEDYRNNATDINAAFIPDFFDSQSGFVTAAHRTQLSELINQKAVIWDNVDSVSLYNVRQEAVSYLEPLDEQLNACLLDTKQFVATEFGSIYLYLWEC